MQVIAVLKFAFLIGLEIQMFHLALPRPLPICRFHEAV